MLVSEDEGLKRMTRLLLQGATLLDIPCPSCDSPLFKLKSGELYCPNCQKRVVRAQEVPKVSQSAVIDSLNQTICRKLMELNELITKEEDQERLGVYLKNLVSWLEALEKTKRLSA
jgi:UPF0148 protein